jgi:hypothetical protein
MSHPRPGTSSVLNYAAPARQRIRLLDAIVWLMPVWCVLIIGAAYFPVRHRDDPFWFAAMGLPFAAAFGCAFRRRWGLAWYCLAICLVVTAIGVALPSLNHAT